MPRQPKEKGAPRTCVRSYLFKVDARCNGSKVRDLTALQTEWRRLLPIVGSHLWTEFLSGYLPAKSLSSTVSVDSVFGQTPLVTSVKQCLAVAVEGQLKSWKSNLQRRITRLVMRSDRYAKNEGLRHQLLWLNSMKLWLVPFAKQVEALAAAGDKTKVTALNSRCSRLLARYVRAYLHRFSGPKFDNLPLQVNQMSSVWTNTNHTKLDGVNHWLRVSTLKSGKRIELPIRGNDYANRFNGEAALTFSLLERDGNWFVKVCKKLVKAAPRTGPVLGLDTGMTNLLATSQGAIFGTTFGEHLKRWDASLQRLMKGLQGAGQTRLSECRRYRDFVHRMRGWLTSEVKGAVNRALKLGTPGTVVIEALTFSLQDGTLSKKMNRLVRRMGTGILKSALEQKSEMQGFKLVEVNPAYTSQECGSCGFISRKNRKGNRFKCVCCGKQAHADSHASRNLVERFNQGRVCEYVKHTTLGLQGLEIWAKRMLVRIHRSTPGTSRHQGVIGHVRAGLKALEGKGASLPAIEQLQRLLSGLSVGHAVQVS